MIGHPRFQNPKFKIWDYMSYNLNSLKGVIDGTIQGSIQGTIIGVIKGDIRSLDSRVHVLLAGIMQNHRIPSLPCAK